MASGIASPWGLTPNMVAGLNPSLDYNQQHLTGQLAMTSQPITFNNKRELISPLINQNAPLFTAFGKKRKRFNLKSINKDIHFLRK